MKTFEEYLNEGMPRGAIAGFDGPDGEIIIYKKGFGFYGDTGDFDFSAKNVKELKKILKDIGANPNKPSFGELPEDRDYKDEYKKFQSSTERKKYRAELNKYNRQKGTYGNKDKKDASHKDGKIVGFEDESINRGRSEKSRLKVDEKTEYYLDTSQDNTEKYVANDGDYWYTGKIGIRGGDRYLKFAATHGKNSYFEKAKLKKTTPEKLEKDVGFTVDFKKLYKR